MYFKAKKIHLECLYEIDNLYRIQPTNKHILFLCKYLYVKHRICDKIGEKKLLIHNDK